MRIANIWFELESFLRRKFTYRSRREGRILHKAATALFNEDTASIAPLYANVQRIIE